MGWEVKIHALDDKGKTRQAIANEHVRRPALTETFVRFSDLQTEFIPAAEKTNSSTGETFMSKPQVCFTATLAGEDAQGVDRTGQVKKWWVNTPSAPKDGVSWVWMSLYRGAGLTNDQVKALLDSEGNITLTNQPFDGTSGCLYHCPKDESKSGYEQNMIQTEEKWNKAKSAFLAKKATQAAQVKNNPGKSSDNHGTVDMPWGSNNAAVGSDDVMSMLASNQA
jgi:hypothetical protein